MSEHSNQPGPFIGIDWADQKHDCYVIDRDGKGFHLQIAHSADEIDTWVAEMLALAGGRPIAIMLERIPQGDQEGCCDTLVRIHVLSFRLKINP